MKFEESVGIVVLAINLANVICGPRLLPPPSRVLTSSVLLAFTFAWLVFVVTT